MVDIDEDAWRGQAVTPSDTIRVSGEVDNDWNEVKVNVETLEKIGAAPVNKGGFSNQ